MLDTFLARSSETPTPRTADCNSISAESQRLEDVSTNSDARIEDNSLLLLTLPNRKRVDVFGDDRKTVKRGPGTVYLTSAVVRDPDAVHACFYSQDRVSTGLDALEDNRAFPVLADKGEVRPAAGDARRELRNGELSGLTVFFLGDVLAARILQKKGGGLEKMSKEARREGRERTMALALPSRYFFWNTGSEKTFATPLPKTKGL